MRADALPPEVERELDAIDAALAGRPVDPDLSELAALATELRDDRPEPDAAFAADLDRRVAAGFPREPGRFARLRARLPVPMPALAFAASLLIALAVAVPVLRDRAADAPVGGSATMDSPDAAVEQAPEAASPPVAEDRASGGGGAIAPGAVEPGASLPSVPATGQADAAPERRVERSASLTLVTEPGRLETVADGIVRTADSLGGFVVSSSVSESGGDGGGTFELRVPSERLGQALGRLSRLAHVRDRQQATRDITAETAGAAERLREARAERRSVLRRLERAETDEATGSLRRRLRIVEARVRASRAEVARLDNRAAFSTIVVTLVTDRDGAAGGEDRDGTWSPADAARDALRLLEVAAGVAIVALAALLPLGLLALLGGAAARRIGHRRRDRALDVG